MLVRHPGSHTYVTSLTFDVAGFTCEVANLTIKVPDLRPGGTCLNLTPATTAIYYYSVQKL